MIRLFVLLVSLALIAGCASQPSSRYKMEQDKAPKGQFDATTVPELTPKWEAMSWQGNTSPYTVRGESYNILSSAKGYVEEGISSWYGLKFHGELTSNGEAYDMYSLSAAHKTLPLPSYVKVTNLQNGRELIVRVNDRGPFHDDRIIDLSYAAAIKLGFQGQGTARVRLEAITFDAPNSNSVAGATDQLQDRLAPFVQVAAFSSKEPAEALRQRLETSYSVANAFVAQATNSASPLYRVRVGPFSSVGQAAGLVTKLKQFKIGAPQVLTRSVNAAGE